MKKIQIYLLLILGIGVLSNGYAQTQTFETLDDNIKKIVNSFAISNAVALLHASTWNTAYIGQITNLKFGIGWNLTGSISHVDRIFGNNLKKDLQRLNFNAIPGISVVAPFSIRLGGLGGIPLDFGVYIGYFSKNMLASMVNVPLSKLSGFSLDALTLGFDTRYALIGKGSNFGISVGLAYLYQGNNVGFDLDTPEFSAVDKQNNAVRISLNDVGIHFNFSTHTVGLRTQLSKTYLFRFLEVSFALEPFFTVSNVTVKTSGDLHVTVPNRTYKYSDYTNKVAKIINVPFIKDGHMNFNYTPITGGLRLFLGNSIKIWVLYIDLNVGYEPFSSTLLASLGVRIGL